MQFQLSLEDVALTLIIFALLISLLQFLWNLRVFVVRRALRNLIVKSLETPNSISPTFFVGVPTAASLIKGRQCYQAFKLIFKLHKEVRNYGK